MDWGVHSQLALGAEVRNDFFFSFCLLNGECSDCVMTSLQCHLALDSHVISMSADMALALAWRFFSVCVAFVALLVVSSLCSAPHIPTLLLMPVSWSKSVMAGYDIADDNENQVRSDRVMV